MLNLMVGRGILKFVVAAGTGRVISNVVKATTPVMAGAIERTVIAVGSFAISSVVGDYIAKAFDESFFGKPKPVEEPKPEEPAKVG